MINERKFDVLLGDNFQSYSPKIQDGVLKKSLHSQVKPSRLSAIEKPIVRIRSKLKAEDIVFAAISARENVPKKLNFQYLEPKLVHHSARNLPPLKPTIHISSYSPKNNLFNHHPSSNLLTITFNSKQLQKQNLF